MSRGRRSLIPEIEAKLGRPIQEIVSELAAEGGPKLVSETLGVSQRTAYNLLHECGVKFKSDGKFPRIRYEGELPKLIDKFLMAKEIGGKTKATLRFYGTNLRRFLWWLDREHLTLELKTLNPDLVRRFLHYVQTEVNRFGDTSNSARHKASRSTLDAYWRTFQAFFSWLVREEYVDELRNPMRRVDRPRQIKTIIPDIPKEALVKIVNSFDDSFQGKRDKAIILVFLDTGVRLSELVGMTLKDLNSRDGLVKVFGKGQKERIVRVSPITLRAIKEYLTVRPQGSPWLWTTWAGGQFTLWGVANMVRRLKKLVPEVKISPHVFRHTFAVDFLRGNGTAESRGDIVSLQQIGGWADLNMPRQYAAALKLEDAYRVHEIASPVTNIFGGDHEPD